MDIFSSQHRKAEGIALFLMLALLGGNAFLSAGFGFLLPVFLVTVLPSAALAFFFPRSGLIVSLLLTVFFERFFTLQPIVFGEIAYKLYPLDIMLVAVFASIAAVLVRERGSFFRFRLSDGLLLGFFVFVTGEFVFSLLSASTESSLSTAFSTWKNYVFYGAVAFLAAMFIRSKDDLVSFAKLFLSGVAAAGIFLLIGIVRGGGLWTEFTPLSTPGTRFLAFPHAFSFSLGFLVIVLSVPYWSGKDRFRDVLFPVLILVLSLGVVGSLMRHLWLGIGITLLLAALVSPFRFGGRSVSYFSRFVFPIVLGFAALAFLFAAFPSSAPSRSASYGLEVVSERIISIGDSYDESFAWRQEVWESSLREFSESPWFGIGFGARVPVEIGDEYRQFVEIRNMHNSWLAMLIQTGIVGVSIFAAYLLALFLPLFRAGITDPFLRTARFVLLGLVAFQSAVFFSQPYLETNLLGIFFWVSLGVTRAVLVLASEKRIT